MPRAPEADERSADGVESPPYGASERQRVLVWRYSQARQLGIGPVEARRFAASDGDVEALRVLVGRRGCSPALAVEIVV